MGSRISFIKCDRDMDLYSVYRTIVEEGGCRNEIQAIRKAIFTGARRFWVTEECLRKVIYRMNKGDSLNDMKGVKRDMYVELYSRYLEKATEGRSVIDVCHEIILQPAPRFYLNVDTAVKIIRRIKKDMQCEKIRNMVQ